MRTNKNNTELIKYPNKRTDTQTSPMQIFVFYIFIYFASWWQFSLLAPRKRKEAPRVAGTNSPARRRPPQRAAGLHHAAAAAAAAALALN